MKRGTTKPVLRVTAVSFFLVLILFTGLSAQGSGRPKVLVFAPHSGMDRKVVEEFQWELARALDRSGNFDIVSEKEYQNYLKLIKFPRISDIPDSIIPEMLDSLKASIYTVGSMSQPGGSGTEVKAKIDFIFPKNEYTLQGEESSVADERQLEKLSGQLAEVIIRASEKISFMSIARSYYNSAIYDKAIENFEKLLTLDPKDVKVHYMIATCYLKMNNFQMAVQKFQEILSTIDPDHIPSLETLANNYFSQGDYQNAVKYYQILAGKKPDNYAYIQYWAYSLVKLDKKEEAEKIYDRLVKIKDEDPAIRLQMGYYEYTKAGELESAGDSALARKHAALAVANFDRAVQLARQNTNPDSSAREMLCTYLNYDALCELKAGNPKKALKIFSELVEMKPDYPNAYYNMGKTAYDNGQFNEALNYYQEAAKHMPENTLANIYQAIGMLYRKKDDYTRAADVFTTALKHAPAASRNSLLFLRGLSYHDYGNQLDFSSDENADMETLIETSQMTQDRADLALAMYDKAVPDLNAVTGNYAKSAKAHVERIGQLRDRIAKIKQQIAYYDKTK